MGNANNSWSPCERKAEVGSPLIRAEGELKKKAHEIGKNRKDKVFP